MNDSINLRPVMDAERQCRAKRVTWPTRQCGLIAGHDGEHRAHGERRQDSITWRTGQESR